MDDFEGLREAIVRVLKDNNHNTNTMSEPQSKKAKPSGENEDIEFILKMFRDFITKKHGEEKLTRYIVNNCEGANADEYAERARDLREDGKLFATIEELCEPTDFEINEGEEGVKQWANLKKLVCRSEPPNFQRRYLPKDTTHAKDKDRFKEYFITHNCAKKEEAPPSDLTAGTDRSTKINDKLIPVDIFGNTDLEGRQKAHLLPKARKDAVTWGDPAVAVLGLHNPDGVLMDGTDKSALCGALGGEVEGKKHHGIRMEGKKYPGIRNMLSNRVRMQGQKEFFDNKPSVCIFPIFTLDEAKSWAGEGYEAIVVCKDAATARKIGLAGVKVETDREIAATVTANATEINKALKLASTLCKFLALSMFHKGKEKVAKYNTSVEMKEAHEAFRAEKEKTMTIPKEYKPTLKPVFKISFKGHKTENAEGHPAKGDPAEGHPAKGDPAEGHPAKGDPAEGHPAPDPMLLGFKSCKNWCQTFSKFQMVAAAEPDDSDDDLSEEGKEHLRAYMEWQAEQDKGQRHDEIMNVFGYNGKGVEITTATAAAIM